MLKPVLKKTNGKSHQILICLIDLFLQTGKPIGSETLRDHGLNQLSPATIRNYFMKLEKMGMLQQIHSSGGRIPTEKAFRFYADCKVAAPGVVPDAIITKIRASLKMDNHNIVKTLHDAADTLSDILGLPVFISAPRFDQDFISDVKLLPLDNNRILSVVMTDFGQVFTDVLLTESKISSFSAKRIEMFMRARLQQQTGVEPLTDEEEAKALSIYNEIMVRFLVRYSRFQEEDLHRTGFSRLLRFTELNDPVALASTLALFETPVQMRLLLNHSVRHNKMFCRIGKELELTSSTASASCSVVTIPFRIKKTPVGAIGVLGPLRVPYGTIFDILNVFAHELTETLTSSLYKFKLSFRLPDQESYTLNPTERLLIEPTYDKLLHVKENT
ncbi:heat-inducible transcriptional repressor HrcA [Candidatus Clavichlamydia salmonicola]|uniref:heat-inducible transcriptional repressor HrcA n=1 Tax=Candidatus Clavichlamydia salmonicola TaxID=469812 RepID=UPI0018910497|nr:heat-inducible transcriptional repressor HrcA [Candidatus Clavichlamydia salmonicola]